MHTRKITCDIAYGVVKWSKNIEAGGHLRLLQDTGMKLCVSRAIMMLTQISKADIVVISVTKEKLAVIIVAVGVSQIVAVQNLSWLATI